MSKQDVAIGVAAGVAIAALAPLAILIAIGGGGRPLMRALSRGGHVLSDKARETFAEFQEITEDFVTEMRAPSDSIAASGVAAGAAESTSSSSDAAPAGTAGLDTATAA